MSPAVLVSIIAFLGTLVPALMSRLQQRHKDRGEERRADYQDTQDDLAATRLELRSYRAETQAQLRQLRAETLALDGEVVVLRGEVERGEVPPLKPRPAAP